MLAYWSPVNGKVNETYRPLSVLTISNKRTDFSAGLVADYAYEQESNDAGEVTIRSDYGKKDFRAFTPWLDLTRYENSFGWFVSVAHKFSKNWKIETETDVPYGAAGFVFRFKNWDFRLSGIYTPGIFLPGASSVNVLPNPSFFSYTSN